MGETSAQNNEHKKAEATASIGGLLAFFKLKLIPAYFGLALVCVWDYGVQRLPPTPPTESNAWFQVLYFCGLATSCFALSALSVRRKKSLIISPIIAVIFSFLAAGCVLATAFYEQLGLASSALYLLAFLGGLCAGCLYVSWGHFYQKLAARQSIFILFCSVIIASILKAVLSLIASPLLTMIVYLILPALSYLCLKLSMNNLPINNPGTQKYHAKTFWAFKRMIVGMVVFSFSIGVLLGMNVGFFSLSPVAQSFTHLLVILICVGIILLTYRRSEFLEFSNAWFLVLFIIATALTAGQFLPASLESLPLAIIAAAQRFVAVFIWLALADVAHNSAYASNTVFGFGKGAYALFVAFGLIVAHFLDYRFGEMQLSVLVVYVLLIALFFFIRDSAPQPLKLLGELSPTLATEWVKELSQRVNALAEQYGLSEREKEIITLYAQGRSRQFISSQLFISENTVRDHIRNSYRKIHIHNKQELIDAIQKY